MEKHINNWKEFLNEDKEQFDLDMKNLMDKSKKSTTNVDDKNEDDFVYN